MSLVKEIKSTLISSVNGAEEETGQNNEPTRNTSATDTNRSHKIKRYLARCFNGRNKKEEALAERKRQVHLRLEYQMQMLKSDQEGRARETDEQLRQLEEQKTFEMLTPEISTDDEDELYPENSKNQDVPDSGDHLAISAAVTMKTLWVKTENLFKHRETINKMPTMLQPYLSGNTVTAGWDHQCQKAEMLCLEVLQ